MDILLPVNVNDVKFVKPVSGVRSDILLLSARSDIKDVKPLNGEISDISLPPPHEFPLLKKSSYSLINPLIELKSEILLLPIESLSRLVKFPNTDISEILLEFIYNSFKLINGAKGETSDILLPLRLSCVNFARLLKGEMSDILLHSVTLLEPPVTLLFPALIEINSVKLLKGVVLAKRGKYTLRQLLPKESFIKTFRVRTNT